MRPIPLVFVALFVVAALPARVGTQAEVTPTFNKDVAPMVFNNCATCHRPNQVAPMSLTSFREVRPWARAIRDKVVRGEMPPWRADGRYGTFRNDRRLTPEQIKTIVAWVDAGAPEGTTPLTAQLPAVNDGWSHPSGRPPDLVIEMAQPFNVPAEGELPNFTIYQELPPELRQQEHFLEAIQILPGVIPAVHHASWGIVPRLAPGQKIGAGEAWPGGPVVPGALLDARTGKSVGFQGDANEAAGEVDVEAVGRRTEFGGARFCCYVPGGNFQQFRDGAGKRIPTEGYIAWGLHYTPIGRPVPDRTRVGLWFQKEITHEIVEITTGRTTHIVQGKQLVDDAFTPVRTSGVGNAGFPAIPVIPPHAKNWAITAIRAFPDDVTLYVLWPHMHTRGKEMTYVLTYPDGREEVLLSVPYYDFNWQIFYELKEPKKIPAGSTIKTIGSYDNSAANKWNPAPQKEVYWSEQSWDEMYVGFLDISVDKQDLRLQRNSGAPQTTSSR
ncbi:MAG: cytochrome c [Acidobacteria bacterium]|nr:cytochrome c [Acidobacteriota bacterium]